MPENEMMETEADGIVGKLQVRLVEEGCLLYTSDAADDQ